MTLKFNLNTCGSTAIEFFLSIIALFLLLIISYPIFQERLEDDAINRIKDNLNQIRNCADQYFGEYDLNSVSLYEFIGPRKAISDLVIIADEEYPKTIFRGKEISAYSKKYGIITIQ